MSSPKFTETHNLVALLKKPTEYEEFKHIVDFLNANPIKYALTVNPTINTSCIQQFWDSAKVKTVNEVVQIRALIDGKKIIVNEASIRRDLKLRSKKSRRKQRKETEVLHIELQTRESIPTPSNDLLPSGEDRMQLTKLMNLCTKMSDRVLSLKQINTNQVAEIKKLKKRVKKLKASENVEQDATVAEMTVNTFTDMNTKIVEECLKKSQAEVTEGSSKSAGDEIEQESAKRQRLEKEDDIAKLKRCLEIVSEDDDDNMVYYLLVEKMYPYTHNILRQLWKDVRLEVDYEVEMAYDILRLIRRHINEGYIPA
nr:hypothetical protein [Tanacetum cinerariifolium]